MHLETMHALVAEFLKKGDFAIDATTGWGHDFMHLCQCTGLEGEVWGFDVQMQAIESTKKRLEHYLDGQKSSHQLFCESHSSIASKIWDALQKKGLDHLTDPGALRKRLNLKCVVFNLGYLPKTDKKVITEPESTLSAIYQSLSFLADGGICAVTVYPGHTGGDLEALQVKQLLAQLPSRKWKSHTLFLSNAPSSMEKSQDVCPASLYETQLKKLSSEKRVLRDLYHESFSSDIDAKMSSNQAPELIIAVRRRT